MKHILSKSYQSVLSKIISECIYIFIDKDNIFFFSLFLTRENSNVGKTAEDF